MTLSSTIYPTEQALLSDAKYFLHQFNAAKDCFSFVQTSQQQITQTTFLDGRENFSTEEIFYQLSSEQLFQQKSQPVKDSISGTAPRFIFHVGFCGSTLLAKCLGEMATSILCYKEPQVLIDFAKLKETNHFLYHDKEKWRQYLLSASAQLGKAYNTEQVAVLKPSNWVNSIAPDLVYEMPQSRAIFISMPVEQFIIAILRGGKDRISFIYQLRQHLQSVLPEFNQLCQQVDNSNDDIMLQVVKSAILVHQMQQQLFRQAQAMLPESQWLAIDYQQLTTQPLKTIKHAIEVLDISVTEDNISIAIEASFKQHAKSAQHQFNPSVQCEIDRQVYANFQSVIEAGLVWLRDNDNLAVGTDNAVRKTA